MNAYDSSSYIHFRFSPRRDSYRFSFFSSGQTVLLLGCRLFAVQPSPSNDPVFFFCVLHFTLALLFAFYISKV